MYAHVHAGGDKGLDLEALACQGVLVVSITIVASASECRAKLLMSL